MRSSSTARGTQRRSALSLVASTIEGKQRDDIAVLTLMMSARPLRDIKVALPATLLSVRRTRALIARMLREAGADEDRRFDLEPAVGEAANNAVEHAQKLGGDEFVLRVRCRPSRIEVEILDQGTWEPSEAIPQNVDPLSDRGRGLMIMRAVCDDVRIERTREGTSVRLELKLTR